MCVFCIVSVMWYTSGVFYSFEADNRINNPDSASDVQCLHQKYTTCAGVNVYVYVGVNVYVYVGVNVYVYARVNVYVCVGVNVYVYVGVNIYVCVGVNVYVYASVNVYVCIGVNVYVCTTMSSMCGVFNESKERLHLAWRGSN